MDISQLTAVLHYLFIYLFVPTSSRLELYIQLLHKHTWNLKHQASPDTTYSIRSRLFLLARSIPLRNPIRSLAFSHLLQIKHPEPYPNLSHHVFTPKGLDTSYSILPETQHSRTNYKYTIIIKVGFHRRNKQLPASSLYIEYLLVYCKTFLTTHKLLHSNIFSRFT